MPQASDHWMGVGLPPWRARARKTEALAWASRAGPKLAPEADHEAVRHFRRSLAQVRLQIQLFEVCQLAHAEVVGDAEVRRAAYSLPFHCAEDEKCRRR